MPYFTPFKFEFPAACLSAVEIPPNGVVGIEMLAFRLRSDNVALYKIVTRFSLDKNRDVG